MKIFCFAESVLLYYELFHSTKQSLPIRHILEELGHKQIHPTPNKTDNSTSVGYVNKNIQMKRSKTWDMHLHWLRDKEKHKQFKVYWEKGSKNYSDYFTKHFPIIHHCRVQNTKTYIQDKTDNDT